jgi:hypothetical protein
VRCGGQQLRKRAEALGVIVDGVLWLADEIEKAMLIPSADPEFWPKCNTPADLIIGTADQDLRECCHAMLFAFVG